MAAIKTIAKNTLALSLGEIGTKIISFAFNIFLARLLGVSTYGQYALVNAFVGLFSFLPDLGSNLIVIRDIASQPKRHALLVGRAIVINLCLSLLSFFLITVLFTSITSSPVPFLAVIFAAATLMLTSLRTVAILQFDAHEHMLWSASLSLVNNLVSVSTAVLGFAWVHSLAGLFGGVLVGSIFTTILAWWLTSWHYPLPKFSSTIPQTLSLLKSGLPLGLAALSAQIYSRLDTVVIGRFMHSQAVGWYAAASTLVIAASQLVIVPLMAAVFPTLSRLRENLKEFHRTSALITAAIILATWLVVAVTQLISSPLINIIYGSEFTPSVAVLRTLIFTLPFAALSAFFYKLLIILGRQTSYLKISLMGALINVIANLTLIPSLGMTGGALSAILTQICLTLFYGLALKKYWP